MKLKFLFSSMTAATHAHAAILMSDTQCYSTSYLGDCH
jgi:hypothetical protein